VNIEIKRMSPDLLEQWLCYFDNTAYKEGDEWQACYCMHFHYDDALEKRAGQEKPGSSRPYAVEYINQGKLQGYVALQDGKIIGWCNANDKQAYTSDMRHEDSDRGKKIKSVVCFNIAPEKRRQGIASMLLDMVCQEAAAEGYEYIEAYPFNSGDSQNRDYHGPSGLYEKHGFIVCDTLESCTVVRKYLKKA
jgi:GNAT superfamily N-acetyltransferase